MKPQDLFLGIREFLALLVPGVAFLVLFPKPVLPWLSTPIRIDGSTPDTTLLLLVFLAAALAAGSILAGLAGLLDDPVDLYVARRMDRPLRDDDRRMLTRQIAKLRETEALATELACKINPLAGDPARALPWTPRSFWWNYLRLNCPVATAELDRIEGLQKQFRSLVIVAFAAALFAIEAPVQWHLLQGSWHEISQWKQAFAPLRALLPWLLAATALLVGAFCFAVYVGYRIRFARRLFELAIVHAIPKERIASGTGEFFAPEYRPVAPPISAPAGHVATSRGPGS